MHHPAVVSSCKVLLAMATTAITNLFLSSRVEHEGANKTCCGTFCALSALQHKWLADVSRLGGRQPALNESLTVTAVKDRTPIGAQASLTDDVAGVQLEMTHELPLLLSR